MKYVFGIPENLILEGTLAYSLLQLSNLMDELKNAVINDIKKLWRITDD